jgi:hypothetical protein
VLTSLNLFGNSIGDDGAKAIGDALRVNSVLTECNVRGNEFDVDSAKLLAEVATIKRVMLFGIKHDQKEANFFDKSLDPADAVLIASDVSVSGVLTKLLMGGNNIGDEGGKAIGEALRVNSALTHLDLQYTDLGDDGKRALNEANAKRATAARLEL